MPPKPIFFSISVIVHLGLACLLGWSLIFIVMEGLSSAPTDLFDRWMWPIKIIQDSLPMPRRQPYILCVLANVVVLTGIVGLCDAYVITRGRGVHPALVAAPAAVICSILYVVAVEIVAIHSPFRITVIGGMQLLGSKFLVFFWNVLYIPISALAHKVSILVYRKLFAPSPDPAAA